MRVLSLLCFFAIVLCGRLCLVFYAGSPIPFHDQWYAEAHGILIPSMQHELTIGHFFEPHGDHIIAPTRLLALLIVKAEGKWDCLTEMVVNCALSACCLLPLMAWAIKRDSRGVLAGVLCLVVGVSYGSPLFYGNVVWGFQSQILLMIVFSLGHLFLVTATQGDWKTWGLGMACGLLASVSFGSGYFAVVVSMVVLWVGRRSLGLSRARVGWSLGVGVAIVAVALLLSPSHPALGSLKFGNVVHTFLHALSFPNRVYSYWGILFWMPTVAAMGLMVLRRKLAVDLVFPLAAAAWCLLQALAISLGRNDPVNALAPRYDDILMVGVVANGCLAIGMMKSVLWKTRVARILATGVIMFWAVVVSVKMADFIRIQTRGDVPALVMQSTQQIDLIAGFYRENQDLEILRSKLFPIRPLPDAEFLGALLKRPDIKSLWPDYLFSWRVDDELRQLPWLNSIRREDWFRGCLLVGVIAVVALYVITLWSLFGRASRVGAGVGNAP